jgi:Neuraminidase (sialidase)
MAVSTSRDGGRTWSQPALLSDAPVFNDLGGLAAEPDVPGAAVVVWSNPEAVVDTMFVSRTTDHGATWTRSQVRAPSPANLPGKVVVAHPDGSLLVFVRDEPLDTFAGAGLSSRPVSVIRSMDKGKTWSGATAITADSDGYFWPLATAAPDGPTYLVWGTNTTADGRRELKLRASDDAGATWGPERAVTTVDTHANSITMAPSIAAGANGLVALGHYERSADGLSVMLTRSDNGGLTWTTTRLAGPFAEGSVEHWALGPAPITYQLDVAIAGQRVTTAFAASGAMARQGVTDVYVVTRAR